MAVVLHVLASGSTGNACLLDVDGFGILVDCGVGPTVLEKRLTACGADWRRVHALLLTHTHGDHWNPRTLARLMEQELPFWLHADHEGELSRQNTAWSRWRKAGLIHNFLADEPWSLTEGCVCRPFEVSHDSSPTFGFHFGGPTPGAWSLGYAADLGCWDDRLASLLADVDVLALEFNHDVPMQLASRRSPHLIRRVLGDHGHLSNEQAAEFVAEVLRVSKSGKLRQIVQLHLSQQCNRASLARDAAKQVCAKAKLQLHTSDPRGPGPVVTVSPSPLPEARAAPTRPTRRKSRQNASLQPPTLFSDWE